MYAKLSGLLSSCPLSHLLCKCQLSQGESREAGANCTPAASGKLLRRPARVLLLPSRLAPCHLSQGGRLWFPAQSKLVSPSGRDVAQRQRGLAPSLRELDLPQAKTEGVLQIGKIRMRFALMQTCLRAAPSVTACAVPPSSGRKALVFRTIQTRLSLWERCRAATERAGSFFEGAGFAAGKD